MNLKILTLLVLWVLVASGVSYAQVDLNADGRSEVILVGENSDGGLDWYAQDLNSNELLYLGPFGQSGFPANFGNWGSTDGLRRGAVIRDEQGFFHLVGGVWRAFYVDPE